MQQVKLLSQFTQRFSAKHEHAGFQAEGQVVNSAMFFVIIVNFQQHISNRLLHKYILDNFNLTKKNKKQVALIGLKLNS